jgi:hypothetical protein
MSIVADAADGADGIIGSALPYGRYPDCPRSQPPLAAEDNLNPEGAEEGSGTGQSDFGGSTRMTCDSTVGVKSECGEKPRLPLRRQVGGCRRKRRRPL